MKKVCWTCNLEKPHSEFGNLKSSLDGKQGYCTDCGRQKDKNHYKKSPNRRLAIRKDNKRRIVQAQKFVVDYLRLHPCITCGESDIVVLEFDHRENKEGTINEMVANGYSIAKLKAEIAKCDVRCANCHRRRTAEYFGWYKVSY